MSDASKPIARRGILWGPHALAWLVAVVFLLRAPSFFVDLLNLDECDFWLFGRMVEEGARPYLDVADIKPPLTYFTFLVADLFGLHHRAIAVPLLGVAFVLGTALVLRAAAERWSEDPRVGWAAAWLSLSAGLCEMPSVNAEVLMNLPAALALYALLRAERSGRIAWYAAAGAASGAATLFKLQAGILLIAFAAALAGQAVRRRTTFGAASTRILAVGLGFGAPWLLAVAGAAAWGALPEAYDWVVRRNVFQISSAQIFDLPTVLPSILAGLGAASFAWWLALRRLRGPKDTWLGAVAILLALTFLPVSIGRRFYEHYFLQFVPPLALLGAEELVGLVERAAEQKRLRAFALAFALSVPVVYVAFATARGLTASYAGQEPKARAIAAWLAANTRPEERLFMWGDYSVVYCLADRRPGTRYMRTAPHVGDFDPNHLPAGFDFTPYVSARDVELALADLEAKRPELVVDTAAADLHRWSQFPLARVPALARYVEVNYALVGEPAGARVYRRK